MSSKSKIISDYIIKKRLGKGSYSIVYGGVHKITSQPIAVKHITKSQIKSDILEKLVIEIDILKYISHPNIIHLIDVIISERSIYIVLEYCRGDLSQFLQLYSGGIPESTAVSFTKQLRDALKIFNELGIMHRDLKPQNILLSDLSDSAILKIADFGFAKFAEDLSSTICGSPMYMAPEIIKNQPYNESVDLWSLGIILWEMLTGRVTYRARSWPELVARISEPRPPFPERVSISPECWNLLDRLLQVDIDRRITFDEFYNHPFFNQPVQEPNPTPPQSSWVSPRTNNPFANASLSTTSDLDDWVVVESSSQLVSDLKLGSYTRPKSLELLPEYQQAENYSRQAVDFEMSQNNRDASLYYERSLDLFQDLLSSRDLSQDDKLRVSVKIDCLKERFEKTSFSSNTNE